MEEIKQKILSIDGVPANKAGEWPGIMSSHWGTSSIKILRQKNNYNIFSEIKPVISGQKHFEESRSKEYIFKPSLRTFPHQPLSEEIVKLKTKSDPVFTDQKVYFSKRNFEPTYGVERYPEPYCHIPTGKFNKISTDEYSIENEIGYKKRILTREDMRNSLKISSMGDKPYRNVEYMPKFFEAGGLIVGSTNSLNYQKTTSLKENNFYSSLDLTMKSLNPEKLWTNKVLKEESDFDNDYVKKISKWDKTVLSDFIPKIDKSKQVVSNNKNSKKENVKKKGK